MRIRIEVYDGPRKAAKEFSGASAAAVAEATAFLESHIHHAASFAGRITEMFEESSLNDIESELLLGDVDPTVDDDDDDQLAALPL